MATVVLVESDPEIARVLSTCVMEVGHTPLIAHTVYDALSLAYTLHPYLVISSLDLPVMDGLTPLAHAHVDTDHTKLLLTLQQKINGYLVTLDAEVRDIAQAWAYTTDTDQQTSLLACAVECITLFEQFVQHQRRWNWLLWQWQSNGEPSHCCLYVQGHAQAAEEALDARMVGS